MGLAATSVFALKAVAAWIALQWVLQVVGERVPRVRPVVAAMKAVDDFALVTGTTLCALLLLLPSFVFVVLEVFRYVQVESRARPAKSVADHMARVVDIMNELEVMGDRMKGAALTLRSTEGETTVRGSPFLCAPYRLLTGRRKRCSRQWTRRSRRPPQPSYHRSVATYCSPSAGTASRWNGCTPHSNHRRLT